MDEFCIQIHKQGDPNAYEQVLALIADRYGHGRYRPAPDGEPADVEVRITPPDLDPICVLDEWRHTVLQRRLWTELGQPRVQHGTLSAECVSHDLTVRLRYQIVPEAELALFHQFLEDLPAFLTARFPISSPDFTLEVTLDKLQIHSPTTKPQGGAASTRGVVQAHLTLTDRSDGRRLDAGWFWLCNFYIPGDDGRIIEPGQRKKQRVFDEIALNFPSSIGTWLETTIPENLAAQSSGDATIRDIFEFED